MTNLPGWLYFNQAPMLPGESWKENVVDLTIRNLSLVFPLMAHKGALGLQLGSLTPLLVVFYNAIWGYAAGWWLSWAAMENRTGKVG